MLPAQQADDDDALAAVDHFQNLQQLSYTISGRFVLACADILSTGQCAAWRAQIPTLDTICGLSCGTPLTVEGARLRAASCPFGTLLVCVCGGGVGGGHFRFTGGDSKKGLEGFRMLDSCRQICLSR